MSLRQLTLRCFLVCFVLANHLLAEPTFIRKDIAVGEFPEAVITGDFNGDGSTDLAVAAQEGLFILLNQGGGDFGRPIHTAAAPRTFWLGTSADFNGDGLDDLVGSGFLYLSRGDGTFLPPRYLGVQEAVAAADFDGDAKTDLLFSNYIQGEGVRVFLGNGDGTFRPGAIVTPATTVSVRVANFNGDTLTDVVTVEGDWRGAFLVIFLGRRDGTFDPETRTKLVGSASFADFDGDGRSDLFLFNAQTASGSIMLSKGDGSFQSPVPFVSQVSGHPWALADFTGDGYADLIINQSDRFYLCPGKGDGTFLPAVEQLLGLGLSLGGTPADLDGDGHLDLITVGVGRLYGSGIGSVLLSRSEWRPELRRAVSAASYAAIVAPGSLATLFAPTGATASESASPPWPIRLGGISLEVRDSTGAARLAPLLFVSPTQINFQVPGDNPLGEMTLVITNGVETALTGSMQVDAMAPGLFTVGDSIIPAATGVFVEHDGAQVSVPVFTCLPLPGGADFSCDFEPIPLSTAGDRPIYLSFYGTGFRGANTDNVTCSLNGVQVPVVYAGPQEMPGVDQINIRLLPEVLETIDPEFVEIFGGAEVWVSIRIDGVSANALLMVR